jgi:hypothetical protein
MSRDGDPFPTLYLVLRHLWFTRRVGPEPWDKQQWRFVLTHPALLYFRVVPLKRHGRRRLDQFTCFGACWVTSFPILWP